MVLSRCDGQLLCVSSVLRRSMLDVSVKFVVNGSESSKGVLPLKVYGVCDAFAVDGECNLT